MQGRWGGSRESKAQSVDSLESPQGFAIRVSPVQPGALCYPGFPQRSEGRVEAERRQVTVLFTGMVGFTTFSNAVAR